MSNLKITRGLDTNIASTSTNPIQDGKLSIAKDTGTIYTDTTTTRVATNNPDNLSKPVPVSKGGTGVATLTGLVKGNGTNPMTSAVSGTDYLAPNTAINTNGITDTGGITTKSLSLTDDVPWTNATIVNSNVTQASTSPFSYAIKNGIISFRGSFAVNTALALNTTLFSIPLPSNWNTSYRIVLQALQTNNGQLLTATPLDMSYQSSYPNLLVMQNRGASGSTLPVSSYIISGTAII